MMLGDYPDRCESPCATSLAAIEAALRRIAANVGPIIAAPNERLGRGSC
jgi:hypothetical protein